MSVQVSDATGPHITLGPHNMTFAYIPEPNSHPFWGTLTYPLNYSSGGQSFYSGGALISGGGPMISFEYFYTPFGYFNNKPSLVGDISWQPSTGEGGPTIKCGFALGSN